MGEPTRSELSDSPLNSQGLSGAWTYWTANSALPPAAPSPVSGEPDYVTALRAECERTITLGRLGVPDMVRLSPHYAASLLSDRERLTRELETAKFNAALLEKQVEVKAEHERYYRLEVERLMDEIVRLQGRVPIPPPPASLPSTPSDRE